MMSVSRLAGLLLTVLLLGGCDSGPPQAAADGLLPLADPPTDGAEDRILQRLQAQHGQVARLLEAPDVDPRDLAWSFGRLGMLYHANLGHDLDPARTCYRNARRLDPAGFRWAYLLGHLEQLQGNPEAARTALTEALSLRPNDLPTRLRLAEIARELGRDDQARTLYQEVLDRAPSHAEARASLGRMALDQGDHAAALAHLETAGRLQPEATEIAYLLGRTLLALGEAERAREVMARVPSQANRRVPIRYADPLIGEVTALRTGAQDYSRLAQRAISQGRPAAAVPLLERSVALDPNRPDTRYNLAAALLRLGRSEAAMHRLELLIRDFPDHVLSRVLVARMLSNRGDWDKAFAHLQHAIEADPRDERAFLALGDLRRRHGDMDAALEAYERAIALEPGLGAARFGRALALLGSDRPDAARARLETAVAQLPDDAPLRQLLARLLATTTNPRDTDRSRALELARAGLGDGQPNLNGAETLAMALAGVGNFGAAVAWQQAVVARLQDSPAGVPEHSRQRLAAYRRAEPAAGPWAGAERLSQLRLRNTPGIDTLDR